MFGKKIINISNILIIWIVVVSLATLVKVIPELEETRVTVVASLWVSVYILTIIYIYKMWKKRSILKKKFFLLIAILKTLAFLVIIPMSLIYWLLMTLFSSLGYDYDRQIVVKDNTLYLYIKACFIPDSHCECDSYYSDVYIKNRYFGIMHHIATTDYFIGEIKVENEKLIIMASDDCGRDIGKIKIIEL